MWAGATTAGLTGATNVKFKPLIKPLSRLLHLEDNPDDALLVAGIVAAEWPDCEIKRVDTQASFMAAIAAGGLDLILADYTVPSFDGRGALELTHKLCPEVPFVFLSGTFLPVDQQRAKELGNPKFFVKTGDIGQFRSRVEDILKLLPSSDAAERASPASDPA